MQELNLTFQNEFLGRLYCEMLSVINATIDFYFLVYSHVIVCKALQLHRNVTTHQRPIFHVRMHRNRLAAGLCAPQTRS